MDWPVCAPPGSTHKLAVSVDPRIELLSVVQLLGGYVVGGSLINSDGTMYRRDLDIHFAKHRAHPAVKMFSEMYPRGFAFDAPPNAMLYLSDPPELMVRQPLPVALTQRAGTEQRLNGFFEALRDFARETKFMSFYNAHRPAYRTMVGRMCAKARSMNLVDALERYFGVSQHSYNVMLMPLAIELGYGMNIERPGGGRDLYQMIGRSSVVDSAPVFGEGGAMTLQNIVWHEFGHSFVNPLTEQHRAEVSKYEGLYAPISAQMKSQGYGWEQTVNEHIIRAVTSRLAANEVGEEVGTRELQADRTRGFLYIEPLSERLKEFEIRRDRYRTFADFYPRLLDVFREEKEKAAPRNRSG